MTTIDVNVQPRTINVLRTEVDAIGSNAKGEWTRYLVYAEEVDGTPITDVLKTFDPLDLGHVVVTQKAYVKDGKILSYTLSDVNRKRRPKPTGEARVAALEERVEKLERMVKAFMAAFPEYKP